MFNSLHFVFIGLIVVSVLLVGLVAYLKFRASDFGKDKD